MANPKIQQRTVTIERREARELAGAIAAVASEVKGGSFHLAYALKKNLNALRDECDAIQAAARPTDEFMAYEQARVGLCKDYAAKVNGTPQTNRNGFVIDPARQVGFETALSALQAAHQEAITDEISRRRGEQAFMRETVSIPLLCFPVALLPSDAMTIAQQMALMPLMVDAETLAGVEASTPEV